MRKWFLERGTNGLASPSLCFSDSHLRWEYHLRDGSDFFSEEVLVPTPLIRAAAALQVWPHEKVGSNLSLLAGRTRFIDVHVTASSGSLTIWSDRFRVILERCLRLVGIDAAAEPHDEPTLRGTRSVYMATSTSATRRVSYPDGLGGRIRHSLELHNSNSQCRCGGHD